MENEQLKNIIIDIYDKYKGTYGIRRICTYINKKLEFQVNHKRIYRIMRELGIKSIIRNQAYKGKSWSGRVCENILNRDFVAKRPLQKLCMDITQIAINGQVLYLNAVKDVFNNQIIAYDIGKKNNFSLVKSTLEKLFKLPLDKECILHTDQGFQYTEKKYCDMLEERGIIRSMSRRGNCWDNVPIEIFFGHLKAELIYLLNKNISCQELHRKIEKYIEFYNNERIQIKLMGLSPVEYSRKFFNN